MSDIVDDMIDRDFPKVTNVKFCPYCDEKTIDVSRLFRLLHFCDSCRTGFCISDVETLTNEQMEKAGFKEDKNE